MLFDNYQIVSAAKPPIYKSPTAAIYECRDLRPGGMVAEGGFPLTTVIKLMDDHTSWRRELESRTIVAPKQRNQVLVPVLSAASISLSPLNGIDTEVDVNQLTVMPSSDSVMAIELMTQYANGLIMPMADRNLLEVIQNERLATDKLDHIRDIAEQLGTLISKLHMNGVVHGDIKPR